MLPMKSYIVEAYYKWMVDSGYTPYLLIDATVDYVEVPLDYVEDGKIVLNIAPLATRDLKFHPSYLSFRTQFSGVTYSIYIPMIALHSIFSKENQEENIFDLSQEDIDHPALKPRPRSYFDNEEGGEAGASSKRPPFLKVIK